MNQAIKFNLITYLAFLLFALAGIFYGNEIRTEYDSLRIWGVQNILLLLIGVPFLFFQRTCGLPDFWDPAISNTNRIYYPALIGAAFGIADIFVFKLILHPEPYTSLPPFLQPFPYSIFLYGSGAFEVEVFYRMIPLTLILLLGTRVKQGRYYSIFLWIALLLTSVREPLEQMLSGNIALVLYAFVSGYAMNFLQAWHYKQAGFLSSLALRLGHYVLWHILLGIYVQYFEIQ